MPSSRWWYKEWIVSFRNSFLARGVAKAAGVRWGWGWGWGWRTHCFPECPVVDGRYKDLIASFRNIFWTRGVARAAGVSACEA